MRILRCLFPFAFTGAVLAQGDVEAIWNDPTFHKQFVGAYGILAEVEPRVSPEEVALLERVRPLLAANLPNAEVAVVNAMQPDSSAILDFTLASIQFQQERYSDAAENYQKAVTKFPSFRRAWRNLGLIHAREGHYEQAIAAFTRMIELGGADGHAFGLLGFAHAARGDFQPAEAAYRNALLMQPENTEWRLGLCRCVFKQGKYEDAAALLDALLQRYPEKGDFWLLQAQAFLALKRPLDAIADLEAADRLGKSTLDSLHTLGDLYCSEGLHPLAVSAYRRAIDVDFKQPVARPMRAAELLAARGAVAEARQVVEHLRHACDISLQESDRRKLLKLDARLAMADGSGGKDAVAVLEELVQVDPLDGEALLLLGQYHARQGQPDRAILCYERAAGIEAFEVNARIRQAQVLVGLGRHADAVPLLRRAQELKPREDVARYLEQVERLARARR